MYTAFGDIPIGTMFVYNQKEYLKTKNDRAVILCFTYFFEHGTTVQVLV